MVSLDIGKGLADGWFGDEAMPSQVSSSMGSDEEGLSEEYLAGGSMFLSPDALLSDLGCPDLESVSVPSLSSSASGGADGNSLSDESSPDLDCPGPDSESVSPHFSPEPIGAATPS